MKKSTDDQVGLFQAHGHWTSILLTSILGGLVAAMIFLAIHLVAEIFAVALAEELLNLKK